MIIRAFRSIDAIIVKLAISLRQRREIMKKMACRETDGDAEWPDKTSSRLHRRYNVLDVNIIGIAEQIL